jgi:serine/threonine-protein kinase
MDIREQLERALRGTYAIERELAGGGMSRVFLAEDLALSRRVVIKVLPPDLAGSVSIERFNREIRVAARLAHPHIVPLLTAGELSDLPFYTMPFVSGESLRGRLASGGPLTIADAVRTLRDVASALAYAHMEGVVHRDIKPGNVLIASGSAAVTDFGVAKALAAASSSAEHLTMAGIALGTPSYMAPEQAAADPTADHRVDIYSWGCLAYETFTGETPFGGLALGAQLAAHATATPQPIADRRGDIPARIAALVMRCLAKSPEDRPQSAAELVAVLEGDNAGTPAWLLRVPRWARSRAATRSAMGLLLLGGIGLWARELIARRVSNLDRRRVLLTATDSDSRGAAEYFAERAGALDGIAIIRPEQYQTVRAASASLEAARQLDAGLVLRAESRLDGDSQTVRATLMEVGRGGAILTFPAIRIGASGSMVPLADYRERILGAIELFADPAFGSATVPSGASPRLAAVLALKEALEVEAGLRASPPSVDENAADLLRFDKAVVSDPEFLQARLWFAAGALRRFGGETLADSALTIVDARHQELSVYERAIFDALRSNAAGNHNLSARAWRQAATLASGWPARWFLAMELRDANRPAEARVLLDSLSSISPAFRRALPPILHAQGQFAEELAAVRDEAAHTPSIRQTLDWREAELQALAAHYGPDSVTPRLADLLSLPAETGTSVAFLLVRVGWEVAAHGYPTKAGPIFQRAADWCDRRTPGELDNATVLFDCIEANAYAGRDAAVRLAAVALRRNPGDMSVHGVLSWLAATRGMHSFADSLALLAETEARRRGNRGLPQWIAARVAAAEGDRDRAVSQLREAFAAGAPWVMRFELHRDPAFAPIRDYAPFRALSAPHM